MNRPEISEAFFALEAHLSDFHDVTIADLFAKDARRFADFHAVLDDLLFDFSKHRIDRTTLKLLLDLARAAKLEERRAALFAGAIVNPTEGRAALHMALRNMSGEPMQAQGHDVMPEVLAERQKMLAFAEAVRGGALKTAAGKPSPMSSISASAARTSARRWRRARCRLLSRRISIFISSPMSMAPISPTR